jgi:hypothetical protein
MTAVVAWTALALALLAVLAIFGVAGVLAWCLRRPALALPALGAIATSGLIKPQVPSLPDLDLTGYTAPKE